MARFQGANGALFSGGAGGAPGLAFVEDGGWFRPEIFGDYLLQGPRRFGRKSAQRQLRIVARFISRAAVDLGEGIFERSYQAGRVFQKITQFFARLAYGPPQAVRAAR